MHFDSKRKFSLRTGSGGCLPRQWLPTRGVAGTDPRANEPTL